MNARFLASPIAAAVLVACATAPGPSSSLEQARLRVKAAQADSRIATHAPMELKRAEQALQLTEKVWAADGSPSIVDQNTYITCKRVTMEQEKASILAYKDFTKNAAPQPHT
ncbi:MAG: DUF4398 domain-containing protein, partial [Rhizobacter sp.]